MVNEFVLENYWSMRDTEPYIQLANDLGYETVNTVIHRLNPLHLLLDLRILPSQFLRLI